MGRGDEEMERLQRARRAAVLNVYAYLWERGTHEEGQSFEEMVAALEIGEEQQRERARLELLMQAVAEDRLLATGKLTAQYCSANGLCAFAMTEATQRVMVTYRGTGQGEWIDNGKGLSGLPAQNIYFTYNDQGTMMGLPRICTDFATGQQAEALNWFSKMAAQKGWDRDTPITLTGHSKGGNKAQFVTLHTPLAEECFSFDGQGFSPEALASFALIMGEEYQRRRQKIFNLSAYNDYVNVLGKQAMPQEQIYYLEAPMGEENAHAYHYIEAILDEEGRLRPPHEQGKISRYVENISDRLMALPPSVRQYATVGLMELIQKHVGAPPIGGEQTRLTDDRKGLGLSIGPLLVNLLGAEEGVGALAEIVKSYGDDLIQGIADKIAH